MSSCPTCSDDYAFIYKFSVIGNCLILIFYELNKKNSVSERIVQNGKNTVYCNNKLCLNDLNKLYVSTRRVMLSRPFSGFADYLSLLSDLRIKHYNITTIPLREWKQNIVNCMRAERISKFISIRNVHRRINLFENLGYIRTEQLERFMIKHDLKI